MYTKIFAGALSFSLLLMVGSQAEAIPFEKVSALCDSGKSNADKKVDQRFAQGVLMPISAYDDDPFAQDAGVECVEKEPLVQIEDGRRALWNDRVRVKEEEKVYRRDASGLFQAFAWNPWPLPFPVANTDGSFRFPDEDRFPLFKVERGPDGKIITRDGLQVWTPNTLHRGSTTVFEAAERVKDASEDWAGRLISWGVNGQLPIEPHVLIDFNAFYSPTARELFFGVVPYRLRGSANVQIFESATSWEIAAHECGHAIIATLKPNTDYSIDDATWSESFADQMAMWTSLRDADRVRTLLADTAGDLSHPNALSSFVEAFDALTNGGPMREAVNDLTVSTTSDEVHERSQVFTGAAYRLFLTVYNDVSPHGGDREQALRKAGEIMGVFLTHTADYTPENTTTFENIGKAYLKVDKEFYGGRYRDMLVAEFLRREIFDAGSFSEWLTHEATVPNLRLPGKRSEQDVKTFLSTNLDALGIGPEFGLRLQSVTRDDRFKQTIIRVQLTLGRGSQATPLDNHGIFVFRTNGTLADYHAPLPPTVPTFAPTKALLTTATQRGLDRHGVPLSLVKKPDGQLTVEARVLRGDALHPWLEVFSESHPAGERREVVFPEILYGENAARIDRAGTILTADDLLTQ